jgi:hypothetical protein
MSRTEWLRQSYIGQEAEGGSEMVINAEQLQTGDIVEYGGARHLVVEIRRPRGGAWPMAVGEEGWAIALGTQLLVIESRPSTLTLAA